MNTERPVVVGVDGSGSSAMAAAWAADEAARRPAPLRIVHADQWPSVRPPAPPQVQQPMRRFAMTLLQDAVDAAHARHAELAVDSQLGTGTPIELMLAESRTAQLVVLGSRGLGGFAGMLLGSVASAVAAHGSSPVVVVRGPDLESPPPAEGPVVVGLDGTDRDTPALRFAFDFADRVAAPLTAVHTWSDVPLDAPAGEWHRFMDWEAVQEGEYRLLAERLAGWQQEFPDVKISRVVTRDRPVRSLLEAADSARLLVVGSRGRGGFTGILLGSTSQALLHHAPCPVAVVRDRVPENG